MTGTGLGIGDGGMTKFHGAPGLLELLVQWERYMLNSHINDYLCVMTTAKKTPGFCEKLGQWQPNQWGSRKASLK